MSVKAPTEVMCAFNAAGMATKGPSEARKNPSASSARPERTSALLYGALFWRGKLPQLPGGSGCGKEQVSSEMIQVLQGNMNRTREAGALLEQITREEDSNILLLSEQSYKMNHKY